MKATTNHDQTNEAFSTLRRHDIIDSQITVGPGVWLLAVCFHWLWLVEFMTRSNSSRRLENTASSWPPPTDVEAV